MIGCGIDPEKRVPFEPYLEKTGLDAEALSERINTAFAEVTMAVVLADARFKGIYSTGGALSRVKVAPGKTVPPEHGVQHVLVGFGVQRVRREELVQLDAEGVFQRFQRSNDGFLCRVNVLAADALLFKGGVIAQKLQRRGQVIAHECFQLRRFFGLFLGNAENFGAGIFNRTGQLRHTRIRNFRVQCTQLADDGVITVLVVCRCVRRGGIFCRAGCDDKRVLPAVHIGGRAEQPVGRHALQIAPGFGRADAGSGGQLRDFGPVAAGHIRLVFAVAHVPPAQAPPRGQKTAAQRRKTAAGDGPAQKRAGHQQIQTDGDARNACRCGSQAAQKKRDIRPALRPRRSGRHG